MSLSRIIATLCITGTLASASGCSFDSEEADGVSRRDCEKLRDHLIDLRMQAVTADHEQHRALMQSSLDESFISACVERTTGTDLRCSLAAADSEALAACSGRTE